MDIHVISGKSKNPIIVSCYQTVDKMYVSIALLEDDGEVGLGISEDKQQSIDLSVEQLVSHFPGYKKDNVVHIDFDLDI